MLGRKKKNAKKMSVSIWPVTGRIINDNASNAMKNKSKKNWPLKSKPFESEIVPHCIFQLSFPDLGRKQEKQANTGSTVMKLLCNT